MVKYFLDRLSYSRTFVTMSIISAKDFVGNYGQRELSVWDNGRPRYSYLIPDKVDPVGDITLNRFRSYQVKTEGYRKCSTLATFAQPHLTLSQNDLLSIFWLTTTSGAPRRKFLLVPESDLVQQRKPFEVDLHLGNSWVATPLIDDWK